MGVLREVGGPGRGRGAGRGLSGSRRLGRSRTATCRRVKHRIRAGDGPRVLDRAGAEQAAGEDRLRPRQARRLLRADAGADAGRGRRPARRPDPRRGAEDRRAAAPGSACGPWPSSPAPIRPCSAAPSDRGSAPSCARARTGSTSVPWSDRARAEVRERETTFAEDVSDADMLHAHARPPRRARLRGPRRGRAYAGAP